MLSSPSSSQPNPRKEWPLLHLSFILVGVITTLLGPVLPFLSRHWSLSDAQAGFFFAAQYFGSFLGVLLTSPFLPRFGFPKVTAMGFVSFLLGFLFLGAGPWVLGAFMVGVIGLGYGFANPAINLRATQLPSSNTAAAVTFLNFSWSVGAVICPFLVGLLLPAIGIRGFSFLLASLSLIIFVLHSVRPSGLSASTPARPTHPLAEWLTHLRHPSAIPLFLLYFLYVGTEVAIGGWCASYEKRFALLDVSAFALAPSFFYGFLLAGRGVAPLFLRHHSQLAVSLNGLLLASLGGAIIVTSAGPHTLYLGVALAGFGLAPQYPILVTWLAVIFGSDANWIGALFFAAAGLGGSALPWLVGIVATQTHSLRVGFYIPLAVSLLMAFLALRARPKV